MTFDDILEQALEMLQRRGRVSYRALQRHFAIDDDYLEDLKSEIVDIHQVAVDQDGRMLVWATEKGTTSQSGSASAQTKPPNSVQADNPSPAHTVTTGSPTTEAERRQLTVMFCDLVGSTQLSGQLDPEDLREVIQSYQQTVAEVIAHYHGYIAQYLGDGVLVYFGYPQAHEDDAQRAVRAGLDLLDAMGPLNIQLVQGIGVELAVRMGIHTGLVVVGNIGGGERQELLAMGETPNIAARLEGLAASNQMVISASTRRLLGQAFDLDELGPHHLKGVAEPLQVYGILGERPARVGLRRQR